MFMCSLLFIASEWDVKPDVLKSLQRTHSMFVWKADDWVSSVWAETEREIEKSLCVHEFAHVRVRVCWPNKELSWMFMET